MVNYAKYVVRDDTDGLTKAIEYSFKQKYYDNPIIKKCLKEMSQNSKIVKKLEKDQKYETNGRTSFSFKWFNS